MKILFRCDATPQLGLGHLTRCRALAAELSHQGAQCIMVGPSLLCQNPADAKIFEHWAPLEWDELSERDAIRVTSMATKYDADFLVLDDMRINEKYQWTLVEKGWHWLQFDGARGLPLWADLVVNANPDAQPNYYTEKCKNSNANLLLGPSHAVIRPQFLKTALKRATKQSSRKILILFGGGDDRGAILKTLQILYPVLDKWIFEVVAGRQNPNHTAHREFMASLPKGRARYHIDPKNLPELMTECQIALLAGGTTTYEANLLGLPMVIISIANNQIQQAKAWDRHGQGVYLCDIESLDADRLLNAVQEQLQITQRPEKLVDGLGAQRVAQAIIESCRNLKDEKLVRTNES